MVDSITGPCILGNMMNEATNPMQTVDFTPYAPHWSDILFEGKSVNLVFENIPIQYLDAFKARYKGRNYKLRWRGPRKHRLDRSPFRRQLDCTREDAVSFSVYGY